ncbi:MAG: B12-binding domain-containing radical SAM protein, partial [Candidatus Omnitrophica bacterium]|nr:B12-binding domain-containing radical SAM protein [Candidatus Omnitrophota bacterium]
MKVAFLQETVNQNFGLMYLSAVAKQRGHECELFIEPQEKDFSSAVARFNPDVVGISVITGSHHWALDAAGEVKQRLPGVRVILGGPHPTYFPEIIEQRCVDAVARGEAEISFPAYLHALEHGGDLRDIPGIWVLDDGRINRTEVAPLVDDLSTLPRADRQLYLKYEFFRRHTEVPFITTRGCPYNCSFCYNHVKAQLYRGKGKYLRTRPVDDIIAEMEDTLKLFPAHRSVILADDIIGLDKKWLEEFSEKYAGRVGLPWFTSIRADVVDEFVADRLARAKCFCLSLGLETGDEELRTRVLGKRMTDEQYIRAVRLLKDAGIKVRTS